MGSSLKEKESGSGPETKIVQQGWFAVLIDKTFAFVTLVLVGLATLYWYVLKPLLTIEGKTRQQLSVHLPIAAVLIMAPLYGIYLIPPVRDFVSLSSTRTVNLSNGHRIAFPDRSFFVTDIQRRGVQFDNRTYFSFAGYTETTMQKMKKGQCQVLPRGEKIRLGSVDPPTNAEGFKAKVGYIMRREIGDLSGIDYLMEWVKHPDLWLDRRKLEHIEVDLPKESSWEELVLVWEDIREESDEHRAFEVRALAREYAGVCF